MIYINEFNVSKELKDLFNDLPVDKYTPGNFRFRTFSKFDYINDILSKRTAETFKQDSTINNFLGDVVRTYPEVTDHALYNYSFIDAFKKYSNLTGITEDIGVHMIRIYIKPDAAAAPEGVHQDGFDRIGLYFINRVNVNGGSMQLFKNKDDKPFIDHIMLNEFAIVDDSKYFHNGSALSKVNESQEAYWDVMILTGNIKG